MYITLQANNIFNIFIRWYKKKSYFKVTMSFILLKIYFYLQLTSFKIRI